MYKKILRKIPNRTKVFCIGWHKTGTTTMGEALSLLIYRVVGPHTGTASFFKQDNIEPLLKKLRRGDACQDMPWPVLFKELGREFPKAKFILMIREDWRVRRKAPIIKFLPVAQGDMLHTSASIEKAQSLLKWIPNVSFNNGLDYTIEYHKSTLTR